MLSPAELRKRLLRPGLCTEKELVGCSEKDIARIERHIGQRLPKVYRDLLTVLGRGAGNFMSDIEMFFPQIISLTDETLQKYEEWNTELEDGEVEIVLPKDAFVFASRYGEQDFFFHLK